MLKFTKQPKTPRITSKKHGFPWREQVVSRWFSCWCGWNECWCGSVYKEMELEMDCLTSRILLQKVCSYKYQFCTKVCVSSRLISHVHMMAGQNIKKKYLMCQIPIKMLKQHAIRNSSLHNLKIYSSKACRKSSQKRLYVCS